MELQSKAQDINLENLVVEDDAMSGPLTLTPIILEVSEGHSFPESHKHNHDHEEPLEVSEPDNVEIVLEDSEDLNLPSHFLGDQIDEAREHLLEIVDEPEESSKKKGKDQDEANDSKPKKMDHWDWESKGHEGFLEWIKDRFKSVPKHSGYDSSGLERAVSYLEKLDNEISKAMRLDLDGNLDANKIEDVRSKIENGIEQLHDRLEKVKKKTKKKKADFEADDVLVKEAGTPGVGGIYIMAPLFISCIARILINGNISAGHDLEHMFKKLSEKYKLNAREKMETIQLLTDMGYTLRLDRGLIDDEVDVTSSDYFDWAASYKA